jgi:putative DNA primase/helicase
MGARFALIEETPEARYLDVKRLKTVLGSPVITARKIRQDNVTWESTHSLFITTNFVPQVAENDRGTWRRLALIRFPYTFIKRHEFPKNEMEKRGDPTLRDRLLQNQNHQLEAALAWTVAGAIKWYQDGRLIPNSTRVEQDTNDWRKDSDHVGAYVEECLEFDPNAFVSSTDLLKDFTEWLKDNANTSNRWSPQTFTTRLLQLEDIQTNKVVKRKMGTINGISRPVGTMYLLPDLPEKPNAWLGLKFKVPTQKPPSYIPGQF